MFFDLESATNYTDWPSDVTPFITWIGWQREALRAVAENAQRDFTIDEITEYAEKLPTNDRARAEFWIVAGPDIDELTKSETARSLAAKQYATIEDFAPLRNMCSTICGQSPEAAGQCTMAIMAASNHHAYVAMFGPVQSLLSRERYASSARFSRDIFFHVRRSSNFPRDDLRRLDHCVYRRAYELD